MSEFSKMTEGMVSQILSRLPPRSLMRFKCVRKAWYTLINNPKFASMHLYNSIHKSLSTCIFFKRFVLKDPNTDEKELVFSLLNICNENDGDDEHIITHYIAEDINVPHSMGLKTRGQFIGLEVLQSVSIIGHCDGIICLADSSNNVVLCNPSIKEFKLLPQPCLKKGIDQCTVGFGYDHKSKDYKVHRVVSYGEDMYDEQRLVIYPPGVEIYTLSSDSWREIGADYLETETTIFWPECFHVYLKGICYWLGHEQQKDFMSYFDRPDEDNRQVVILFDTVDEVFHNVLFPHTLYEPYAGLFDVHLILWKESSVALFGSHRIGAGLDSYGLWVLDDFGGVKDSWTKLLAFEPIVGIERSLEFWKSDEILMVATDGSIVSYNLGTDQLREISIHSMHPSYSETVVCVNSLVSITG